MKSDRGYEWKDNSDRSLGEMAHNHQVLIDELEQEEFRGSGPGPGTHDSVTQSSTNPVIT